MCIPIGGEADPTKISQSLFRIDIRKIGPYSELVTMVKLREEKTNGVKRPLYSTVNFSVKIGNNQGVHNNTTESKSAALARTSSPISSGLLRTSQLETSEQLASSSNLCLRELLG